MSIENDPNSGAQPAAGSEPRMAELNESTTAANSVESLPLPYPSASTTAAQPIVARYGQYYRNTRYIMTVVTIVMGFWFLYDGFVRYPAENAKIDDLKKQQDAAQARLDEPELARIGTELKAHTSHSPTDLLIQRLLAFGLPPAGLLLLLWALYNSRGEYRLAEDILHIPGHPPVPLGSIRELDETLWDRKGIAIMNYSLSDGKAGKIKLDDFVYDRSPTDKIFDRIRASMQAPVSADAPAIVP